jgi:CRP/FNR family transcriptional regulator/CRP/FNR family cyclic AMP-dependent transcriptional regulator
MTTAPVAQDLAAVGPFRHLDEASRSVVAKWFETQSYEAGEIVVHEGDGKAFFVIADGTASVSLDGDDFALLEAGDYFGEMSILYGEHRTGTVIAVTPIKVWAMFGTRHQELAYA